MNHGSLFSGIGGFDLAAQWMGWKNIFHCEWNEFGQKVLKYYWPNAISYGDITKTDFTIHRGRIDILTGGFPCQPYSIAGKRKGKEDDRHLWPEMLRAIREIQPGYIVGENVRGITNWNGGMVFDEVQSDLENQGYEILPFLLPACGVNAPHRRDRIWFIGYSASNRRERKGTEIENENRQSKSEYDGKLEGRFERLRIYELIANTQCIGQQGSGRTEGQMCSTKNGNWKASWINSDGGWPTVSPLCNGNDGLSGELDGITFYKWYQESLKAGGNAIVPQVALQIFKAIQQYENIKGNV